MNQVKPSENESGNKKQSVTWQMNCCMSAYAQLAEVRFDKLFLDAEAIIHAFKVGQPRAQEMFGPEVTYTDPNIAGISYGHVNCLGAPLLFPENSEVAHEPIFGSLDDAVAALSRPVDWASAGRMPFYLDLWRKVCDAFPERKIPFCCFQSEGPFTTAWALRGHDFFMDLYDDPPLCRRYLDLITESLLSYGKFIREVNQAHNVKWAFMADDMAAMLQPEMWETLVVPVINAYFDLQKVEVRVAHIENLTVNHLPYLDCLGLDLFDPTVSPRITPGDLSRCCSVPFEWHLNPMQMREFTLCEILQYLHHAADQGASKLVCHIERDTIMNQQQPQVSTFIQTCLDICR